MVELIDKWAVVDELICIENWYQQNKTGIDVAYTLYRKIVDLEIAVGKIPSKIVYCKDCKAYDTKGCCPGFGWCLAYDAGRTEEDFCQSGERKDND